jgi:hypothetical protein
MRTQELFGERGLGVQACVPPDFSGAPGSCLVLRGGRVEGFVVLGAGLNPDARRVMRWCARLPRLKAEYDAQYENAWRALSATTEDKR